LAIVAVVIALGGPIMPARAAEAPPSAVGDESVFWVAPSPAYTHTGLLLEMSTPFTGCSGNCTQLWVTHDGGRSWTRSPAAGWNEGRPVIAVDAGGKEVVFAATSTGMTRSDDQGASWHQVGGAGALPALSPNFAHDAMVAVASGGRGGDYILRGVTSQPVTGSGGAINDLQFALSPSYPGDGLFPPALLSGADPSTNLPVIQHCSAALACSGSTTLPGAVNFSAPVTLLPAGDFPGTGVVFAQSGRGVYKSVDGGRSFTALTIINGADTATTATPSVALAPGYRDRGRVRTLFTSVFSVHPDPTNPYTDGGVYRSDDGGATWRRMGSPSPLDGGSTAVAVAPDGRLFAGYLGTSDAGGTHGGLLCSSDGGSSWRASCPAVGDRGSSAGKPQPRGSGAPVSSTGAPTGGATQCGIAGCATPSPSGGAAGGGGGRDGQGSPGHTSGGAVAIVVGALLLIGVGAAAAYVRFGRN
jgi:hypothetical protein